MLTHMGLWYVRHDEVTEGIIEIPFSIHIRNRPYLHISRYPKMCYIPSEYPLVKTNFYFWKSLSSVEDSRIYFFPPGNARLL